MIWLIGNYILETPILFTDYSVFLWLTYIRMCLCAICRYQVHEKKFFFLRLCQNILCNSFSPLILHQLDDRLRRPGTANRRVREHMRVTKFNRTLFTYDDDYELVVSNALRPFLRIVNGHRQIWNCLVLLSLSWENYFIRRNNNETLIAFP
jgi:hypothetical protein